MKPRAVYEAAASRVYMRTVGHPLFRHALAHPRALARWVAGVVWWPVLWAAVWALQWRFAPTWMVDSRTGAATALQALPGAIVGVVALIVGSIFVIAAQVVTLYGARAILILFLDRRLLVSASRAMALAVAALLIGGDVPDAGKPTHAVTAGIATISLASALVLLRSVANLAVLLMRYTAPRNFVLAAASNIAGYMRGGLGGLVGFRVPMLGEMIRAALRRGDGVAVVAALEGLVGFTFVYADAVSEDPSVRDLETEDGVRSNWFAEDLATVFQRAGEEALRFGAAEPDLDAIANALETCLVAFVTAELIPEADAMLTASARLGVSSHQVSSATTNLFSYSAPTLATAEDAAEHVGERNLAARALAAWALVVSYTESHFGREHPQKSTSAKLLGSAPPWKEAADILRSEEWRVRWANKMDEGADAVVARLDGVRKTLK